MSDSIQLMDCSQRERVFIDIWEWIRAMIWKTFLVTESIHFLNFSSNKHIDGALLNNQVLNWYLHLFEEILYHEHRCDFINSVDCLCLNEIFMFWYEKYQIHTIFWFIFKQGRHLMKLLIAVFINYNHNCSTNQSSIHTFVSERTFVLYFPK